MTAEGPELPARRETAGPVAHGRLTDEEAARILERASRTGLGRRLPDPHDLTLPELMEVAAEAGLDAAAVRRAAAVRPGIPGGTQTAVFGGPTSRSVEATAATPLPEDRSVLAQAAARVVGRPGRVTSSEADRWVWETEGGVAHTRVTLQEGAGGTALAIQVNRAGVLGLTYFPLLVGAGALSGTLGLFASVSASAGPLVALLGLFGLPLLVARPLFRRLDRGSQERLEELAMELLRVMEEGGRDAAGDGDGAG